MGASLFLSFVGGLLSIVFGVLIRDELPIIAFSNYMKKSMIDLVMIVGITVGVVVIICSLVGILFITPF